MQDFTLTTYKKLLQELLTTGYSFQTFQDFIQQPEPLSRESWELATDTHRLTQTFVRQASPAKNGHRFARKKQHARYKAKVVGGSVLVTLFPNVSFRTYGQAL